MGMGWTHMAAEDGSGRYVLTSLLLADLVISVSASPTGSSPSVKYSDSPASSSPVQSHGLSHDTATGWLHRHKILEF